MPPPQASLTLPGSAAVAPVDLRWVGGWVLAQVRINSAEAGWFKIAAWEQSCIDPAVARRLKLRELPVFGILDEELRKGGAARANHWFRADVFECGAARGGDVKLEEYDMTKMSEESVKLYGEGISGVLGWDLLRTVPFLLDEPQLQLTWQKQMTPPSEGKRLALLDPVKYPIAEVVLGEGIKARSFLNFSGLATAFQPRFLQAHADKVWKGPEGAATSLFYYGLKDDDELPVRPFVAEWPARRWIPLQFGGTTVVTPAIKAPPTAVPLPWDMEFGYGVLRRVRLLVDGPGRSLWVIPSSTVPEVTLAGKGRPRASPVVLTRALSEAIANNDATAVRALAAAGVPLEPASPEDAASGLGLACLWGARDTALALLELGAKPDPFPGQKLEGTPLTAAAGTGDPVLIKALLDRGADPGRLTVNTYTALVAAARSGGAAAVDALRGRLRFPSDIAGAADLMVEACEGTNLALVKEMRAVIGEAALKNPYWKNHMARCLEFALLRGDEETVAWLLKDGGDGIARAADQLQPLLAAILPTRIEKTDAVRQRLVARLIKAGADPNASRSGITPLLMAARHGNALIVKSLLAAGARTGDTDFKGRSALHRAAAASQPVELLALMLKSGVEPDEPDPTNDVTPLGKYAMDGDVAACEALLAAGAAPDARATFGKSPLMLAAESKIPTDEQGTSVVSLLLKHGAKLTPDATGLDGHRNLFLWIAIKAGRPAVIPLLLRAGLDVNGVAGKKVTPLAFAAATSNAATVDILLQAGADPRAVDEFGIGIMAHAAAAGRVDIMELLLKRGISPDPGSPRGVPALVAAVNAGQLSAAEVLLKAGATVSAQNPKSGESSMDAATQRGDAAMVRLLEHPPSKP